MGVGFFIEGGRNSPNGDQPISVKRVTRTDVDLKAGDLIISISEIFVVIVILLFYIFLFLFLK